MDLVDTKYEFGRLPTGKLCVIDEVHTPDSSRLWKSNNFATRIESGLAPKCLIRNNSSLPNDQGFSGNGPVPYVPAKN